MYEQLLKDLLKLKKKYKRTLSCYIECNNEFKTAVTIGEYKYWNTDELYEALESNLIDEKQYLTACKTFELADMSKPIAKKKADIELLSELISTVANKTKEGDKNNV